MTARSSVDTLREERRQIFKALDDPIVPTGPSTLTKDQRAIWAMFRVAVVDAQIKEDEFLNSLLPEPLTDERREEIVNDLYNEELDIGGREYADLMDFAHESDYSLVEQHAALFEGEDDPESTEPGGTSGGALR